MYDISDDKNGTYDESTWVVGCGPEHVQIWFCRVLACHFLYPAWLESTYGVGFNIAGLLPTSM